MHRKDTSTRPSEGQHLSLISQQTFVVYLRDAERYLSNFATTEHFSSPLRLIFGVWHTVWKARQHPCDLKWKAKCGGAIPNKSSDYWLSRIVHTRALLSTEKDFHPRVCLHRAAWQIIMKYEA
jgi:hypothetical protein